eukprot:7150131-Alexandrium_andersonii.AAC.1
MLHCVACLRQEWASNGWCVEWRDQVGEAAWPCGGQAPGPQTVHTGGGACGQWTRAAPLPGT